MCHFSLDGNLRADRYALADGYIAQNRVTMLHADADPDDDVFGDERVLLIIVEPDFVLGIDGVELL